MAALLVNALIVGATVAGMKVFAWAGMTLYGMLNFLAHDGLVRKRWAPRGDYRKRLYPAHRLHQPYAQGVEKP